MYNDTLIARTELGLNYVQIVNSFMHSSKENQTFNLGNEVKMEII